MIAGDIIDHFGLRRYFRAVHGSELDGTNAIKADLIAHILATEPVESGRTVMIGDRLHDIEGAKANAVAAIGVLWGYGDRAELDQAGAARIASHPRQLGGLIASLLAVEGTQPTMPAAI